MLSDGDDESAGSGSNPGTPGSQSSTDSVGVVQIAPVRLSLPVRLLSDGDDGYAVASVLDGQVADAGGSTSGSEALTRGH